MANLWELIIDAANETETGIPLISSIPSISEYVRWANKGQDIIAAFTKSLEQEIAFPSVQGQIDYVLPNNFIRPIYVEWVEASQSRRMLLPTNIIEFKKMSSMNFTQGIPQNYTVFENRLKIFRPLFSSAQTTTVSGANSATATTINLTDTTGFATTGRLRIYTSATVYEDIDYYSKTATSIICNISDRGKNGTTPAAYTGGETVTELDLLIWSVVRYLYKPYNIYTTGTATFTNASATVTAGSTAPYWSGNVFPNWQIGLGTNPSKWYNITAVGTNLTIDSNYAEGTLTNQPYTIAPVCDLRPEFNDSLVKYMIYRTHKRKTEVDEAKLVYADFVEHITDIRYQMIDRTDQEFPISQFEDDNYPNNFP